MSVSTRVSIAWAPEFTASEPTDTLVLTGKTFFVDQRLLSPGANTAESKTKRGTVDWAFAGTRSAKDAEVPGHSYCSWTHLVSSRFTTAADECVDEGYMQPHPTDSELALETGAMAHPDSGVVTAYREVWRDEDAAVGDGVLFWECGDGKWEDRGFVGVIGGNALAVGRADGAFYTWRAKRGADGWEVLFESGGRRGWDLLGVDVADATVGGVVATGESGGQRWVCREAWAVESK
ncbi:hypothetical protein Dda_9289 [Drechslerella dactyloides]|uniref:Protein HRI1 n=1 Tax=Drechslerella dactyloides TaxID=74499 RepID=A0AAD6IPI7_DREDA|nr:hypothetical protein Dda_9289 [Drechslerella dactyloides]